MKLIFEYELVNNGWASILIKTRKEKLQFPISCVLYDTFKLLVRATRRLLLNKPYIEI